MNQLVLFRWAGGVMRPANRFAQSKADALFTEGDEYILEEHRDRSDRTHDHFFACVSEVWKNLSDEALVEFPTPEALRKRALINTGFRDERTIVCASRAEAHRVAAFVRPIDEYAVVVVHECMVVQLTAKSQSKKAMGAAMFQDSKEKVLQNLSEMIGIDVTTLRREAGMAA